jgi:hypothetical protein
MSKTGSKIMNTKYESPFAIPDDAEVIWNVNVDFQNEREIKRAQKRGKNQKLKPQNMGKRRKKNWNYHSIT